MTWAYVLQETIAGMSPESIIGVTMIICFVATWFELAMMWAVHSSDLEKIHKRIDERNRGENDKRNGVHSKVKK